MNKDNSAIQLNPQQESAVQQIEGPVIIIAGPGSGKTRVLTYRIAFLMSEGIDPFSIHRNGLIRRVKLRIDNDAFRWVCN